MLHNSGSKTWSNMPLSLKLLESIVKSEKIEIDDEDIKCISRILSGDSVELGAKSNTNNWHL